MSGRARASDRTGLSAREREVLALMLKGLANKAIARELCVAEGTVKLHLHRIYRKLGAKGRFELAVRLRDASGKVSSGS